MGAAVALAAVVVGGAGALVLPSLACGGFPRLGSLSEGPDNKDHGILVFIWGPFILGKYLTSTCPLNRSLPSCRPRV